MRVVFYKPETPAAVAPVIPVTPAAAVEDVVEEVSDDSEIIAAITAAVAVMMDADIKNVRLNSVRKSGERVNINTNAWQNAARQQTLNNRI